MQQLIRCVISVAMMYVPKKYLILLAIFTFSLSSYAQSINDYYQSKDNFSIPEYSGDDTEDYVNQMFDKMEAAMLAFSVAGVTLETLKKVTSAQELYLIESVIENENIWGECASDFAKTSKAIGGLPTQEDAYDKKVCRIIKYRSKKMYKEKSVATWGSLGVEFVLSEYYINHYEMYSPMVQCLLKGLQMVDDISNIKEKCPNKK